MHFGSCPLVTILRGTLTLKYIHQWLIGLEALVNPGEVIVIVVAIVVWFEIC